MKNYTLEELTNIEKHFKQFKNEIINHSFQSWIELIENVIKQAKENIKLKDKLSDADFGKIGTIGGEL